MFPVIGIERWHSIKTPFEMTANLQRVRILNGEISQILRIKTFIKLFIEEKCSSEKYIVIQSQTIDILML